MRRISEGTHSTVYHLLPSELDPETPEHLLRGTRSIPDDDGINRTYSGVCVKVVPAGKAVLLPHDVHQEIKLLGSLSHPNIIKLLHHSLNRQKGAWELFFPFYPYTLQQLFDEPNFAPLDYHKAGASGKDPTQAGSSQHGGKGGGNGIEGGNGIDFLDNLLQARRDADTPGLPTALSSSPLCNEIGLDDSISSPLRTRVYNDLTKSIVGQLTDALSYMHGNGVAHRDVKPGNIMLEPIEPSGSAASERGARVRAILIDLGTALEISKGETSLTPRSRTVVQPAKWPGWMGDDHPRDQDDDNEEKTKYMIPQVGSGAYRAPELLFGTTCYDPYALDSWALGCIVAGFFSGLIWGLNDDEVEVGDEDNRSSDSGEEGQGQTKAGSGWKLGKTRRTNTIEEDKDVLGARYKPFVLDFYPQTRKASPWDGPNFGRNQSNKSTRVVPREWNPVWRRETLFDASRGEIGLAASIFGIRGTPGVEGVGEWKSFGSLPDANKVTFEPRLRKSLLDVLPFLRPLSGVESDDSKGSDRVEWPDVLEGLLRLEPKERTTMVRLKQSLSP